MKTNSEEIVDISGTPLKVGDKVACKYDQLFRVGVILRLTPKRVVVGFNFTSGRNPDAPLTEARLAPWTMAKVCNQNVGLTEYYDYIKIPMPWEKN